MLDHPSSSPGDDSWHFSGFLSSRQDWLTGNDELQGEPLQQCATYAEAKGHSSDVCYLPMYSRVAALPYQLPSFEQPVKGEHERKILSCLLACATNSFIYVLKKNCGGNIYGSKILVSERQNRTKWAPIVIVFSV